MPRAFVENAADRRQTAEVERKERERYKQWQADVRELMALPAGRRVFWSLLEWCGVFHSIFDNSGSRMAHNSGRQDVGHYLQAEVIGAAPERYTEMQLEAIQETK